MEFDLDDEELKATRKMFGLEDMELEEDIDNVKFLIRDLKASSYNQTFINSLEMVLEALENSIPKNKIEEMLKEMKERKKNIITSSVYSRDEKLEMLERNRLKREILQELLEENQ